MRSTFYAALVAAFLGLAAVLALGAPLAAQEAGPLPDAVEPGGLAGMLAAAIAFLMTGLVTFAVSAIRKVAGPAAAAYAEKVAAEHLEAVIQRVVQYAIAKADRDGDGRVQLDLGSGAVAEMVEMVIDGAPDTIRRLTGTDPRAAAPVLARRVVASATEALKWEPLPAPLEG